MTARNSLVRGLACVACVVELTQSPARAGDLVVGSGSTVFARGDAVQGGFAILSACGGSLHSIASDGDDLFLGATNDNVDHYEFGLGVTNYTLAVSNDGIGPAEGPYAPQRGSRAHLLGLFALGSSRRSASSVA